MTALDLMKHWKQDRSKYSEEFGLRSYRAISWLDKAEAVEDLDSKFIFYWISFNAAYADDINKKISETRCLLEFLSNVINRDSKGLVRATVNELNNTFKEIISCKYVYKSFWDFEFGRIDESTWLSNFASSNNKAIFALTYSQPNKLLQEILSRLYILRNQI